MKPSYIGAILMALSSLMPFSLFAADSEAGKTKSALCAGCHGVDGNSMEPGMPDFSSGDTLFLPDAELFAQIREGKGVMPAYRGMLLDSEIRDVIAYLRSLQK